MNGESTRSTRDRDVERVLWIEGSANVAVTLVKAVVGFATGSSAVLGDAIHSLADVANNGIALIATRWSHAPPDADHPYGHRKFETLAVFGSATLLSLLAFELAQRAILGEPSPVMRHSWSLGLMVAVLAANVGLTLWEQRWARRLDSEILRADARHTLSDVLTTVAVIASWQLAAMGFEWLDRLASVAIACGIFVLAFGLYRRAIPVLVDHRLVDPDELSELASTVPGVRATRSVRSRLAGGPGAIDLVVSVDPSLPTVDSHAIADAIERTLRARYGVRDVTVHIEPE